MNSNLDTVLAFYRLGLEGKNPRNAFEQYVSPEMVEHKPDVEHGTREATITYLENLIQHPAFAFAKTDEFVGLVMSVSQSPLALLRYLVKRYGLGGSLRQPAAACGS